jgi:hypothetical protein
MMFPSLSTFFLNINLVVIGFLLRDSITTFLFTFFQTFLFAKLMISLYIAGLQNLLSGPKNASSNVDGSRGSDVTEAHKTLGCYKCIIRNEDAEIHYLKTRSDLLAYMIKNHHLTHKQATLAYNLVYISSLKYGLPSTSVSYNQITKLHRYAVDKFIAAMGIDHSTHRALIYGPTEYGGFGVRHLYTEMMGMKLETVIGHIRS